MSGFGSTPTAFRQALNFCQIDCAVEGRCSAPRKSSGKKMQNINVESHNNPDDGKQPKTFGFDLLQFLTF